MGKTLGLKLSTFRKQFNDFSDEKKIQAFIKKPRKKVLGEAHEFVAMIDVSAVVTGIVMKDDLIAIDLLLRRPSVNHERSRQLLRQFIQCCDISNTEKIVAGLNLDGIDLDSSDLDGYFESGDYAFKLAPRNEQIVFGVFNKHNEGAEKLKEKQWSAFPKTEY
ncbi:MAG TPA: hypothetical protein V6C97_09610 [Oculatellaceae cyanobacterium]